MQFFCVEVMIGQPGTHHLHSDKVYLDFDLCMGSYREGKSTQLVKLAFEQRRELYDKDSEFVLDSILEALDRNTQEIFLGFGTASRLSLSSWHVPPSVITVELCDVSYVELP